MSTAAQNESYWAQFSILPTDLEQLSQRLLEKETPATLDELARALVASRLAQLQALREASDARGRKYRPADRYAVGDTILFPLWGDRKGEVIAVREGHNPEYEPFKVIRVRMEDGTEQEFAAELPVEHPLNEMSFLDEEMLSVDEVMERYGEAIVGQLRKALTQSEEFVTVGGRWFVRDLLLDISPVAMNIVEAMLDMASGGPLRTEALLDELDLPDEVPPALRNFSLEYALMRDRRFDEVGPAGYALWYLRRMEPKAVLEVPPHLRYVPVPYDRDRLDEQMLALEQIIDDAWAEAPFAGEMEEPIRVTLFYPHWRSGTLPLTPKLARFFPTAQETDHIRFTFIDGRSGERFAGWVVRSGRYVYGLQAWYEARKVNVGSYIYLSHGEEAGEVVIDVHPFRSRRGEWLRVITVEDNDFSFETTRYPAYCEFDELAAIGTPDPEAIDALAEPLRRLPSDRLVERVFRELAALTLQRVVHATTLYSAVNLFRRLPPAPLLAILASDEHYEALGDHYWVYRGENV